MAPISSPVTIPRYRVNTTDVNKPGSWFEVDYNGRTLKYTLEIIGSQRQSTAGYVLYIGMHGGGGSVDGISNDQEWRDCANNFFRTTMVNYYANQNVPGQFNESAILVCVRGVSSGVGTEDSPLDAWNLHAQPESGVLLEKMITNLIQQNPPELTAWPQLGQNPNNNPQRTNFVNPNRVFLWGFSAGGDGAFLVGTKISDRFAGIIPASGHPNGTHFVNAANVTMLLEAGENDTYPRDTPDISFQRARVYVDAINQINQQRALMPAAYQTKSYPYTAYIVQGGDHNSWSQPGKIDTPQSVLATDPDNLGRWNAKFPSSTSVSISDQNGINYNIANVNPVRFFQNIVRTPMPEYVVWDLTWLPEQPQGYFPRFYYWLCLRKDPSNGTPNTPVVQRASYSSSVGINSIRIYTPNDYLGYMLKDDALSRPLSVYINNDTRPIWSGIVTPQPKIRADSIVARGDKNLQFSAMIYLQTNSAGGWTVRQATSFDDGVAIGRSRL